MCPSPGDLPNSGIEPVALAVPAMQVDSLPLSHVGGDVVEKLCLAQSLSTLPHPKRRHSCTLKAASTMGQAAS